MNNKNILIIIILSSFLYISCSAKLDTTDALNDEKIFKNKVENFLEFAKNSDINKYQTENNKYFIQNNFFDGYSYDNNLLRYLFKTHLSIADYEFNFEYGYIFQKNLEEMYVSIEDKRFCAVKDFNETEIHVYDISDKDNCHYFHYNGKEIYFVIKSKFLSDNKIYESGTLANDYVMLNVVNNIVDRKSYVLNWYRNGEQIGISDINSYVIPLDKEDADYHAEIITPDGTIVKSNVINVKIDRK